MINSWEIISMKGMGNYFCCCYFWENQQKLWSEKKLEPSRTPPKTKYIEQVSSPSALETEELTTIYKLPTADFKTVSQVLKHEGYELLEQIGEGEYVVVKKAKYLETGAIIACKIVNLNRDSRRAKRMLDAKNELFILVKVIHPHIIRMYTHFIIDNNLYIFMELAAICRLLSTNVDHFPYL
jgi:hypothetical protein